MKKKGKRSEPKQHHYVPRWHLEKFINSDGMLTVYDKHLNRFWRQAPQNVMRRNKYYTQDGVPEGVDANIFEKGLASIIEPSAKKIFEKIIQHKSMDNDDETAFLMPYLEIQKIRTPREEEYILAVYYNFLNSFIRNNPNLADVKKALDDKFIEIVINSQARFSYYRTVLGFFRNFLPFMKWEVFCSPNTSSYIISDNPVVLYNPAILPVSSPGHVFKQSSIIRHDPGIGLAGTELIFPMDKYNVLKIRHNLYRVIALDPLMPMNYGEMLDEMKINISYIDVNDDFVRSINYVIYESSYAYVASSEKKTIEEAISFANDIN